VRTRGEAAGYEAVLDSMRRRDEIDSRRAVAPLRVAGDAAVVETTDLTIEDVLAAVERLVEGRGCPPA
jgi:cytidylate kinase